MYKAKTKQGIEYDRITLTRIEAAQFLGIGLSTLDRWIKNDAIPSVRIEGTRLFNYAELQEFTRSKSK